MKTKRYCLSVLIFLGVSLFFVGCLQPSDPKLGAAGIGVSDLDVSTDFYTRVVGMKIKCRIQKKDLQQVVLEFEDSIGSDVILMHYTDDAEHNYTNNPDKLVFYVPDAYAFAAAIAAEGLRIISPPAPQPGLGNVVVGIATDPDGYWVEIIQDMSLTVPYLGGVGIGVSDLETTADFYTRVMGMTEQYRLSLGYMNEIILQYPYEGGGSALVLMHFAMPRNYMDLPLKLTFHVTDPKATVGAIEDEGLEVLVSPRGHAAFNPMAYGLAKDPDGYLVEVLQAAEPKTEAE